MRENAMREQAFNFQQEFPNSSISHVWKNVVNCLLFLLPIQIELNLSLVSTHAFLNFEHQKSKKKVLLYLTNFILIKLKNKSDCQYSKFRAEFVLSVKPKRKIVFSVHYCIFWWKNAWRLMPMHGMTMTVSLASQRSRLYFILSTNSSSLPPNDLQHI